MVYIITKKYEHYNRALGKHIKSKSHYESEMRRAGMVSSDKGEQMAKDYKDKHTKLYDKPGNEAMKLITELDKGRKKGKNVKLSTRQINTMKKIGVNFDPTFKPSGTKGGF